ncbi:MAG: ribosome silencing factor [Alphaproteobacteria bacterium]|nr:ribosome silencing factor [Alphaproteobacteria bacterium]
MEDIVLSERVNAAKDTAATGVAAAISDNDMPGNRLLQLVLKSLESDKAEDVVPIALHGKSEMADYMVIATGRSSRHVVAMSERLSDSLKDELGRGCRMEGRANGDWVLLDCGDVVVHIFRPEVREFYQLEKMWLPDPSAAKT